MKILRTVAMKKIKQAFVRIVRILLMTAIASAAFAQQQIAPRPAPDKPAVPRPAPAQSAQSQASPPAVVPQSTTAIGRAHAPRQMIKSMGGEAGFEQAALRIELSD
jgi:hypothetical protein